MISILKADCNDADVLTQICFLSKAYWGYSQRQIVEWSDTLTITKSNISQNFFYKLCLNKDIIGFYSYYIQDINTIKLDYLFLLPQHIGNGFGKLLMNDFLAKTSLFKGRKIVLEADPNAEIFYQ